MPLHNRLCCAAALFLCAVPARADLQPPFRKLWAFGNDEQFENVAFQRDRAYFGSFKNYGAVDLHAGRVIWGKSFKDPAFGAHVLPDGDTLFMLIGKSHLAACDPATGRERWRIPTKSYAYPLAASGRLLYALLEDGVLTALDKSTHRPVWTLRLEPKSPPKKNDYEDHGMPVEPLLQPYGRMYVASSSGTIFCLNPRTGKLLWKAPVGQHAGIDGWTPVGNRLIVNQRGGPTLEIDRLTGKRLWAAPGTEGGRGTPATLGDTVFVATEPGMLFAIAEETGAIRWSKRLSTSERPDMAPPIIAGGQVVLAVDEKIMAVTPAGAPAWTFEVNDLAFGEPLHPLGDGFVLVGSHDIFRFAHGAPPALPSGSAGRRALAESLVPRIGNLSNDEKKTLTSLGEDAYAALLPHVMQALAAYEPVTKATDTSQRLYSRYHDLLEALTAVMTPAHTPDIIAMLPKPGPKGKDESARSDLLQLLAAKGDRKVTLPLFLDILRNQPFGEERYAYSAGNLALGVVQDSSDPAAVDYMIDALKNPRSKSTVRSAAFTNLARTGGERGVQAVLAARDHTRTLPTFAEKMEIDKLGTKPDPRGWPTRLLAVSKDAQGTTWGLLASPMLGSEGDLWIARHDGQRWVNPLFTGMDISTHGFRRKAPGEDAARAAKAKQLLAGGWVKEFVGNAQLARDADGDGWTDLVEKRLGTDPAKSDTDGDGLPDSRDCNPLAAQRALSDKEAILAAALEARFFGEGAAVPVLVRMPPDVPPMEFRGYPWIVCTVGMKAKPVLDSLYGEGVGLAYFPAPHYDFQGAANMARDWEKDWLLWNADHTEAKTSISVYYGGLNGTVYDVRLRKFGSDWIVVEMKMTIIS